MYWGVFLRSGNGNPLNALRVNHACGRQVPGPRALIKQKSQHIIVLALHFVAGTGLEPVTFGL